MEIHKQLDRLTGAKTHDPKAGGLTSDITQPNRESIAERTEPSRLDRKDRIELSETAQSLKAEQDAETKAREERVEKLKAAHEAGTLNSPERIERAAQNLLSDS